MKSISIDDFTAGRNTLDNQILLQPGECVASSLNVWAPGKALTKMPGTAILYSFTATGTTLASIYADDTIKANQQLYYRIQSSLTVDGYFPWTGQSDSLTPLGYVTGTVAISGGTRISATGSGTTWTAHVSAGDLLRVDSSAASWYKISSVEDDTHLTLTSGIPVDATGAYTAMPALDRVEVPWASFIGSWWSCTTANIMQRYDSTGMTRISAAPKAAFLAVYSNYLFAFRTSTAKSRLYWSTLKDPTSWPTNNFIDIAKDRGKGAGLIAFGNELIAIKNRTMHKVVGDTFDPTNPTYSIQDIAVPPSFQFNSGFSATIHNGVLFLVARNAIYAYEQGTSFIREVSSRWSNDLPTSFSDLDAITGVDQRIHGISFNGHLLFKGFQYADGSKTPIGILDQRGAWWFSRNNNEATSISPFGIVPFAILNATNSQSKLVVGSSTYPRVYHYDILSHLNGSTPEDQYIDPSDASETAISATWASKEYSIEYGHFKSVVIYLKKQSAGNLTLSWSIDQGTFVDNTIDMTVGRGNLIRRVLDVNQRGSTIQLKISQTGANQTFQVYGIRILYEPDLENRLV